MSKDIVCKNCGLVNSANIVEKGNNKMAFCDGCGKFIKNIGYAQDRLFFGKYKNRLVSEIDDKEYLMWLNENVKMNPKLKDAVRLQLEKLLI